MDSDWTLVPWILDSVLSQVHRHLAANLPLTNAADTIEVDCTEKRLIQILDFGGQKKPPFNRLSISDSSAKVFARLSGAATKELEAGTGRRPPSQTEGAVCELIHYSLIFDSSTDGVIVDIRKLLYKGGACMSRIGEPKRLIKQDGVRHMIRAMGTSPVVPEEDEAISSQILSQAELHSDDRDSNSQDEDIATQVPHKINARKKIHHTGTDVIGGSNLISRLEGFNGRKSTAKRPPSSRRASSSSERASKRQHIEQTSQKDVRVPPIVSDQVHLDFKNQILSRAKSTPPSSMLASTTSGLNPLSRTELGQDVATVPNGERGCGRLDRHNTALPEDFHAGSKSLSRRFVSPPKLQLQHLSSNARYVDPRLQQDALSFAVPTHVIRELSVMNSAQQISPNLALELLEAQAAQVGTPLMAEAEACRRTESHLPEPKMHGSSLPVQPEGQAEAEAQEVGDDASSETSGAASWSSSAHGSPTSNPAAIQADVIWTEPEPIRSKEEYLSSLVAIDKEQGHGSPVRLPPIMPAGLSNVRPATSYTNRHSPYAQLPPSSLSIDYELEQEVPLALDSSGESSMTRIKSPAPVPKDIGLGTLRSPLLQVERSPSGLGTGKRVERALFRSTVLGDSDEIVRADAGAVSSDPVIPATCVESHQTISSQIASQLETTQSSSASGPGGAQRVEVLVPATISTQVVPTEIHAVTASNSETNHPGGSLGAVVPQSPSRTLQADKEALQLNPYIAESKQIQKQPPKMKLVATESSQLNSSVDIEEMARANRRSFLAQPDAQERRSLQKNMPQNANDPIPEAHDGADAPLRAHSVEPSARHPSVLPQSRENLFPFLKDNSTPSPTNHKVRELVAAHRLDTSDSISSADATIFGKFKLEYPEFQHELGRFIMACTYIKWLQDNRRLMPLHSYLWDDFIRIFCGPYTNYVRNQKHEAAPPESPVEFYNREVTTPVFKGAIVTQQTLPQALACDPHLTTKHTRRLRRISLNVAARSETTTPQERRAADNLPRSSSPARAAPFPDNHAGDAPDGHQPHSRTPVLSGSRRRETLQDDETDMAKESQNSLPGRLREVQGTEGNVSDIAKIDSSTFITPRRDVFMVKGDGTPTRVGSGMEPRETAMLSHWVQRTEAKKVRSSRSSFRPPEYRI